MPVLHQIHRLITNMEDGVQEEENVDEISKTRRNLFGTVLTDEDRQAAEQELKEIAREAERKLKKYEIVGVLKTFDKEEKPPPRPDEVTDSLQSEGAVEEEEKEEVRVSEGEDK